jgi:hypothetical protein
MAQHSLVLNNESVEPSVALRAMEGKSPTALDWGLKFALSLLYPG